MAAFGKHKNVLALNSYNRCVFLCLNKNEISFVFLLKTCYTSNNKMYNNNSNILIDMVSAFNSLSGLLIIAFIIWQDNSDS